MIDILYWKSFLASEIIVFPDPFLVLIHEWGIKCAVICLLSVVCTNTPESLPGQDCVVTSRLPLNRKLRGDTAIHWPCGHVLSGDLCQVTRYPLLSVRWPAVLCQMTSVRCPGVSPLWCRDDGPLWSDPGPLSHRLHLSLSTDSDGEWRMKIWSELETSYFLPF